MWKRYCRSEQASDESITPFKRIAFWITKATNTHSEYVVLIGVPLQQWLHDRPQCYVIRTVPVVFSVLPVYHTFMLPNVFTRNC